MGRPDAAALLPLAESIADGSAIDWNGVEARASADDQAMIRQLRILAELATLHRTLPADPSTLPNMFAARRASAAPATGRWAQLDLIERIGGGTYGEVYRAWDRHLEREVALKLLRADEAVADPQASRIIAEGRLLARVRHLNVVTVHGVAVHDGRVGLWMELVHGATLEQVLSKQGPFSAREATLVGIDLCRALAALHKAGLIHRDVKAQNVLREDGGRIVLMDLGTGREIGPAGREPVSDFAGTPLYLAPEIFEGEPASERTDLFSLGVLLYHLVTGSFPVRAATIDELKAAHARRERTRLRDARPDLPTAFVHVVDRAIASDPGERYASAGALEADLAKALDGAARPSVQASTSDAPSRRYLKWVLAAMVLTAVGFSVVAAPWVISRLRRSPPAEPRSIRSIAVLPLTNLSGDPAQEYFADGMTDELIGTLGQLGGINVISRTSAMRFKGSKQPLPEIARLLHVDAVLEGSILVAPSRGSDQSPGSKRVRINARLIYSGTDTQLWDRTFEAVLADVLTLQSEVAKAVTDGIGVRLTAQQLAPHGSRGQDFDAFDLYLRGRYHWNKRTKDDLGRSIQYFQEAIDRGYTPAYSGLADAYNLLGFYGLIPAAEARARARAAATRALERDDTLAEAHASLAFVHDQQLEWDAAEAGFKRALALKPGYATAHHWYSLYLLQRSRFDEAIAEIMKALALDPLSNGVNGQLGYVLFCARRYPEAIAQLEKSVQMDPTFARNHLQLAEAYALTSSYDRALAEAGRAAAVGGNDALLRADVGFFHALAGRRREALKIADELIDRSNRREAGAARGLAVVYAGLGNRDRGIYWLERAREVLDPEIADIAVDPRFDNLRGDARFPKILASMGLGQ